MKFIDNLISEFRLIIKDEGLLVFMILVPLAYPLVYSWIYTNEVVWDVPVAVVDKSNSPESRELIRRMDASPCVDVAYRCGSLDEARQLVGHQKVNGILLLPSDFGIRLNRMEQAHVSVYCDMSLMLAYKNIYQTAVAVTRDMGSNIQTKLLGNYTAREDAVSTAPLTFDEQAIFNTTMGYGNCVLPAVLVIVLQQTMLLCIGLTFGTRRERTGALLPSYCNPLSGTFAQSILGFMTCRGLAYLLIYLVLGAYDLLVVPQLFGFVSIIYPADFIIFLLPYLISCLAFSMFAMTAIRQREDVMLIVVFTSIMFIFMSGVSWPLSAMPPFWKYFSYLFPSTLGVQAFVRMNTMGSRITDMLPLIGGMLLQIAVYSIAAYAVLHHTHRNDQKQ